MTQTADGIFRKTNGMWWAIDPIRHDRIYSLHTKDEAVARAVYAKQQENYRLHKENVQLRKQLNKED